MELGKKHFSEPFGMRDGEGNWLGGNSYKFFATDSEQNWNKNKEKLESMGFSEDSITYDINEQGFRSPKSLEAEYDNPIICIGDSSTFGNGIKQEEIWLNFLKEEGEKINLGSQGAGFVTIYRLLKCWVPIIKPVSVYLTEPVQKRPEFYSGKIPTIVGENSRGEDKTFWTNYLSNDRTEAVYRSMALDGIKSLAVEHNFRLYFLETPWDIPLFSDNGWRRNMFLTKKYVLSTLDHTKEGQIARDLLHPGAHINPYIAQEFNHMFDNNLLYGSK